VERVRLTFTVEGEGVEIVHTERAVALALTKYCSVAATLAPGVVVETIVVVNGTAGEVIPQPGSDWSTPLERMERAERYRSRLTLSQQPQPWPLRRTARRSRRECGALSSCLRLDIARRKHS
jgi:hypothetical protein